MKRYFDYGFERIVVVETSSESDFDGFDAEIDEQELPDNFCEWHRYEGYGISRGTATVMSESGD